MADERTHGARFGERQGLAVAHLTCLRIEAVRKTRDIVKRMVAPRGATTDLLSSGLMTPMHIEKVPNRIGGLVCSAITIAARPDMTVGMLRCIRVDIRCIGSVDDSDKCNPAAATYL